MKDKSNQVSLPLPVFQSVWETKGIFSDHYIRTKLRQTPLWPKEEKIKPLWEFCYELWNKRYIGLAQANEAVTRQELLDKILNKLGFSYLPNTRFPMGGEPDYILFSDENTKEQVFEKDKHTQYSAAIGILEAKKVNHPLDTVSRQETPGRFPHQQIKDYLQSATNSLGRPYFKWAILTNGNKWRLYCREAHPDQYFEFDFEHGIRSFKDFMIFATFFNPTAFIKDEEGRCLLDNIRSEALSCQAELEDNLCKRVFNILENLANGFYKRSENKITPTDLSKLYENCLIFLYRLLFILYAEGRGLLPVKLSGSGSNKNYRERYSLQRLFNKFRNPRNYISDEFTDLYEEILALFHLINGDQPSRNKACDVPLYNGGLFDPKEYQLLEQWRIGEQTLAEVLKGLMFGNIPTVRGQQRDLNFGETIDYADLEVRQLGSIYEGLLENHLEIEEDHLVLRGDKSERKATGTYYTPDYIVQYIVKNTLEPLCNEIHKLEKVQSAIKKNVQDNSFAEEVLKFKVLDPAMGSGHFLVRATEFLAEQILYHPTTLLQVKTAPWGLSHQEAEKSYWRRKVVESCIYGVDLNSLAVELAKLSLWLTCITTDQPLSFLDHHLRVGNSLVGAKLADLGSLSKGKTSKQFLFSFGPDLPKAVSEAIRTLKEIGEIESRDIQIVKNKEERWRKEVMAKLKPYRTIADLWTMSFFDMKIDEETYCKLAELISENPTPRTKKAQELKQKLKPYNSYLKTAEENKFFHWEFEFPEVFFSEDGTSKEDSGFDAVIGNPPYVRMESIKELKPFLRKTSTVFHPRADLYCYFLELAFSISKSEGISTFISSNKYFRAGYGKPLRELLSSKTTIRSIINFSGSKVFETATVDTAIIIFQKTQSKDSQFNFVEISSSLSNRQFTDFIHEQIALSKQSELSAIGWGFLIPKLKEIIEKIKTIGTPLENHGIKVARGIVSGAKDIFEIDEEQKNQFIKNDTKAKELIKPIIHGQDIERWQFPKSNRYLLFIKRGTKIEKHQEIFEYLKSHKKILEKRATIENHPWYELQQPQMGIYQEFEKERIIYPDISERPRFALSPAGIYCDNTTYNLITNSKFILAVLNSQLLDLFYKSIANALGNRAVRYFSQYVKRIPIPKLDKKDQKPFIDLVDKILAIKAKNPEADTSALERQIDQMVYDLYGLTEEEIKIVENSRNK